MSKDFNYVQKARIRSYFSGVFSYDVHDVEKLKRCISARGNVFYNHLLHSLIRDGFVDTSELTGFPSNHTEYAHYRFVWLYVEEPDEYFVLCKGPWQHGWENCYALGERYFPEMDFPDDDFQPRFLLAVESKTKCQQSESEGGYGYFGIAKNNPEVSYYLGGDSTLGTVLMMNWTLNDGTAIPLHIFWLEKFDCWYFSYCTDVESALHEIKHM